MLLVESPHNFGDNPPILGDTTLDKATVNDIEVASTARATLNEASAAIGAHLDVLPGGSHISEDSILNLNLETTICTNEGILEVDTREIFDETTSDRSSKTTTKLPPIATPPPETANEVKVYSAARITPE